MSTANRHKRPFLVIVWDDSDDTFTEWIVNASNVCEAKEEGLNARLRHNREDPDEHEPDERGGKLGYLPILAYDHEFLDAIFPR